MGETDGFDGGFAGVFAAKAAAKVGDDDADFVLGDVEGGGNFATDAEGILAGGPDRHFSGGVPFGDGSAGFHRAMLDVGDVEGRGELFRRAGGFVGEGIGGDAAAGVIAQVFVERGAGGFARFIPFGGIGERGEGLLGDMGIGCGDADEVSVADDGDAGDCFGFGEIDIGELCAVGGRAEDFAVEHAGADDVGGIGVRAGDDLATIGAGGRDAKDFPVFGGRDFNIAIRGLLESGGVGGYEVGVGEMGVAVGEGGEQLSGAGAGGADARESAGRGAAAGGDAVVGDEIGVGHEESDLREGDAEFFGGGLGDLGAGALAAFDFAGEDGDGAVSGDVEAGIERRGG